MGGNPLMYKPVVAKGEHVVSNEVFMDYFLPHFKTQLRDYDADPSAAVEKAKHIALSSMKIENRYFVRSVDTLHEPLSSQEQRDQLVDIGLKMSLPAVESALKNAGIKSEEVNCIVFVSHQPFPFPPFTAHLMSAMSFHRDCTQIPVTSMGCGGGGFALDTSLTYLRAHPTHNVLVLCLELCSLGFRTHRSGMSWFLNAALFGDAVAAFVVRGCQSRSECSPPTSEPLELVASKQRLVPGTCDVSFFEYDEWGYHFITTQALCDVVRKNCPEFAEDLAREAFNKAPAQLYLNVIHPGGTRMIKEVGQALQLQGSLSEQLATDCMADGGNIASASVIDMIARSWELLPEGSELICVGMGPGFVMCGAALLRGADVKNVFERAETSGYCSAQ